MFADARLVNLFPVPLWVHALAPEDAAGVNETVLAAVERMRAAKPELGAPDLGSKESWQTDNDLRDDPDFAGLAGFIREAAEGVLGHLSVQYNSFLITGLWANVTPAGSTPHRSHTHPDNFLSGVYYVKAPPGGNSIVFHDPKPQTNITPRFSEPNPHNSRNAHIDVQAGALILFPAWLPYSVEQNTGESEQISLGFNIKFA